MNQIIIELCADDRARLDAIIGGLAALAKQEPVVVPVAAPAPAPVEAPVDKHAMHPTPGTAPAVDEKKYTLADVQGRFVKVIAAGKKSAAQAILKDYAEAVTQIPAEKYAEVMRRLSEI